MRTKILQVLFIIWALQTFSQSFSKHPIAITPLNKPVFNYNDSIYKSYLVKRYSDKFIFQGRMDDFVEMNVSNAREIFNGNYVYSNLQKETQYLETLLQKTIPKELFSDDIKVYIVKDNYPNAYCREDGSIFIHIGLLSLYDTEAELASVLCHEFGHYYYMHSVKRFKKVSTAVDIMGVGQLLSIYNIIISPVTAVTLFHQIRKQEKQSDMMAAKLFAKNNFSPNAIITEKEKDLVNEAASKSEKGYRKPSGILSTHPATKKRLKRMRKAVKNIKNNNYHFQADSVMFRKLRERVTDECIYNYFEYGDYYNCYRLSYLKHLQYPEDEFYLYFSLESLRRRLALYPKLGEKIFITEHYYVPKTNRRSKRTSSIHYNLATVYGLNKEEIVMLQNKKLSDTSNIEFITNRNALDYFSKEAMNCRECYSSLRHMGLPFTTPDTAGFATELQHLLYSQTFSKTEENKMNPQFPVFFSNLIQTKRGKKVLKRSQLDTTSVETSSFRIYLNGKSEQARAELDSTFNLLPALNFREAASVNQLLTLLSNKLVYDNFNVTNGFKKSHFYKQKSKPVVSEINLYNDIPELHAIVKKYNYRKIFFVDFVETKPNGGFSPPGRNSMDLLIYCLDPLKNKVYRISKKCDFKFSSKEEIFNLYPQLIDYLKELKAKPLN